MGTNNSKENSDLTLSTIDNNDNNHTWRSFIKNKTINYSGWQEICRWRGQGGQAC